MMELKRLRAIGLMSGTSVDGVDAAIVETDGVDVFANNISITRHYEASLKKAIFAVLGDKGLIDSDKVHKAELLLTLFHRDTVKDLLNKAGLSETDIDVIGFHGHTVVHNPAFKITRQLGDAQLLANELKIPVISRFRNVDIKAGGQGAPLEAAYLTAISSDLPKPLGIINIGGIANVTLIGENGEFQAFHTGTGNALLDEWMQKRYGVEMDFDGVEAARGTPDERILAKLFTDEFFAKAPPKSLDREYFRYALTDLDGLSVADGAATLTAFTVRAIKRAVDDFASVKPENWIVYGGGANNPTMMKYLKELFGVNVRNASEAGWNPVTLEAQSFAFLAVRSLFGLPLTFPSTTGVAEALSGGKLFNPENITEA